MADFVSAVGVLTCATRERARSETTSATALNRTGESASDRVASDVLVWSAPSQKDERKVMQLLQCLLSSAIDQTELFTEYGKQRFHVVKMAMSDGDDDVARDASSPLSSSTVGFNVTTHSVPELVSKLRDLESSLSAEKRLAQAIFPTEELAHAAFRYAAHPVLDALRGDLEASLQQQGTSSDRHAVDPFKLLALHEAVGTRASDLEALVVPPLLLRDRKGVGRDDPWVLSQQLAGIVTHLATVTKQKLFGFQLELTDRIGVGDRSLSKDGNVHPVSSYVRTVSLSLASRAPVWTVGGGDWTGC